MGCQWSKQIDEVVCDVDRPSPNLHRIVSTKASNSKPLTTATTGEQLQPIRQRDDNSQTSTSTSSSSLRASVKESVRRFTQSKGLSPIYHNLPPKAQQCTVKHVYDGDTLTLTTHKRVRFLGVDTPELENPVQAFSREAKAYTEIRCCSPQRASTIWISFEPGHETEDRFGRLLWWVWVEVDLGDGKKRYECVNEGLVQHGLASVYCPNNSKFETLPKLLAMQKQARVRGKGMWSNFHDYPVVQAPHGTAFHHQNKQCEHIYKSNHLVPIMASEAMDEGRNACRKCLADC